MSFFSLLIGAILIGTAVIVYIAIGNAGPEGIDGLPSGMDPEKVVRIVQYGVSGLVGGLGALFFLGGLKGLATNAKQRKLAARLMRTGLDAEGTVTFVDKNWAIKVNQRPIYSIVEYTYQDSSGTEHTRRVDKLNSELVIRKQIQVGSKIPVKYAPEDPSKSVMVLQ